jgi:outer membrane lipoprotein-sorting protein
MVIRTVSRSLVVAILLLGWVPVASAQTADEIIDKHLAAIGGRAALGKLKSRSMTGTITLSTPGGDISGPVEILTQAPNKSRTLINLDLSALGAGAMTLDQRFDGTSGYIRDSLRGNRDIAGSQLEAMRNGSFPSALLDYKERGSTIELGGKEKVGDREAYVLIVKPKAGSPVRHFIDASSYLPIKAVLTVDAPQMGEVQQTTEFADFREVDGVKVPFTVKVSSPIQNSVVTITKVEHNTKIDEALFSKPPGERNELFDRDIASPSQATSAAAAAPRRGLGH